MATIVLNVPSGDPNGIDMSQIFGYDNSWSVVSVTSSVVKFSDGDRMDYFRGTGLSIDGAGRFSGTVTSWQATDLASGFVYAELKGVSVPAADVQAAIENNTEAALLASLLSGVDSITGSAGADVIDAHAGADTMTGLGGDDVYYVDVSGDKVVEASGGGTDLVRSQASSYTLAANVENGQLDATGTASMTGNTLSNTLFAGAGNNVIDGVSGNDTVSYANAAAGVTVSLAITSAQATGGSGSDTLRNIDNLVGSRYADTLTGNAGSNRLDGGAGADHMAGGDGNDSYVVVQSGDVVTESSASGGTDTVYSSLANYTLGSNVENGVANGSGAINLTGNELNNVLTAGAGNNVLKGGSGIDKAEYSDADAAVTVSLALTTAQATGGSGSDTLQSIENLLGSRFADKLTGSSGANTLTGGAGSDKLTGGGGADRFVLDSLTGSDTITDFVSGTDHLAVNPKAIVIGDGDSTLDGALTRSAPGGFAKTAELVVFTSNISGSITAASAAAKIGAATSAYAAGDHVLFAVDNGSASALYLFTSAGTDATVSASELTLLATLSATPSTTVADYLLGS